MASTTFLSLPSEIHEKIFDYAMTDDTPLAPEHANTPLNLLVSKLYYSRALRSYYKHGSIAYVDTIAGRARFRAIPQVMKNFITAIKFVDVDKLKHGSDEKQYPWVSGVDMLDYDSLMANPEDPPHYYDPVQEDTTNAPVLAHRTPVSCKATPEPELTRLAAIIAQCPNLTDVEFESLVPWPATRGIYTERLNARSKIWWETLRHIPTVIIPPTHIHLRAYFAVKLVLRLHPEWTMAQWIEIGSSLGLWRPTEGRVDPCRWFSYLDVMSVMYYDQLGSGQNSKSLIHLEVLREECFSFVDETSPGLSWGLFFEKSDDEYLGNRDWAGCFVKKSRWLLFDEWMEGFLVPHEDFGFERSAITGGLSEEHYHRLLFDSWVESPVDQKELFGFERPASTADRTWEYFQRGMAQEECNELTSVSGLSS